MFKENIFRFYQMKIKVDLVYSLTLNDKENKMLPEYNISKGVRGKYAARYAKGSNIAVLEPDVARVFPNSQSVNEALRSLIHVVQQLPKRKKQVA